MDGQLRGVGLSVSVVMMQLKRIIQCSRSLYLALRVGFDPLAIIWFESYLKVKGRN